MKKLLLALPVVLISGACNAENVDVFGVSCELVANGTMSALVKCPAAPELLEIQAQTPNAQFQEVVFGDKYLTECLASDPDSIFVNIIPDECGADTTAFRVMVKEPVLDGVAMYAVHKCM